MLRSHEDRRRQGHRLQPGSQFRHAQAHHRGRHLGPRRRHVEWPRAGGGQLPHRPRRPAADRPRRAAHRRHLAVPLQGRLLAPRSGHHVGDRRRRHGALGHSRQVAERAGLSAARRRIARRRDGLRPRQRIDRRRHGGGGRPLRGRWATRRFARSAACPGSSTRTASAAATSTTSPQKRAFHRDAMEQRAVSELRAVAVRAAARASSAPTSTCCTTCITG